MRPKGTSSLERPRIAGIQSPPGVYPANSLVLKNSGFVTHLTQDEQLQQEKAASLIRLGNESFLARAFRSPNSEPQRRVELTVCNFFWMWGIYVGGSAAISNRRLCQMIQSRRQSVNCRSDACTFQRQPDPWVGLRVSPQFGFKCQELSLD